ncbi:UNVERIFIED_CONTAM: hypothetical protein K2H54_003251 [Gekko kuhli]
MCELEAKNCGDFGAAATGSQDQGLGPEEPATLAEGRVDSVPGLRGARCPLPPGKVYKKVLLHPFGSPRPRPPLQNWHKRAPPLQTLTGSGHRISRRTRQSWEKDRGGWPG